MEMIFFEHARPNKMKPLTLSFYFKLELPKNIKIE
jgi:hypothetical protein